MVHRRFWGWGCTGEMIPDPGVDGSTSLSLSLPFSLPFSPAQAPLPQQLQSTPSRWTNLSLWPWTRWERVLWWAAAPRSAPCPRWAWSQYLCLPWPPCPWGWHRCRPWAPSGWARGWALQDQCPKLCTVQECLQQPPSLQIQLTLSSYKDPIKGTFSFPSVSRLKSFQRNERGLCGLNGVWETWKVDLQFTVMIFEELSLLTS